MKSKLIKIKNLFLTRFINGAMYAFFRLKITYEDPEMKKHPPAGIYICNHMSHFDGFIVRTVLWRVKLYSLITDDWYDKKAVRSLIFFENCIPVNRDNPGTAWIHACRKVLKAGDSVNIFPEGHTSKSEKMDVFKPGFLMLASLCKDVPIIPVATVGVSKIFIGERKRILVGTPIMPDRKRLTADSEQLEEYAAEFRNIILEMKHKLKGSIDTDENRTCS